MNKFDIYVNTFWNSHLTYSGLSIMNKVTSILSPENILIITAIGIAYFLYKKQWRHVAISFFAIGGGIVSGIAIKSIIARLRPESLFIIENGYSFPSNHAMASTIFFTLIIYFFILKIKSVIWRNIFLSHAIFIAILISFSRVYLGVHWFSDVLCGMIFGFLWTLMVIFLVRVFNRQNRIQSQ